MTRAQAVSAIVNTAADAMLHALAASRDHGIARRQNRRCQCRRPNNSLKHRRRCCAGTCCANLVPFGSPLLDTCRAGASSRRRRERIQGRSCARRAIPANDWSISTSRRLPEYPDHVVIMLQERTIADKMDRQLTHRGAARSVIALAAMLAHEIKNPFSGIRGAAQLLEQSASDEDRRADKAHL